MSKLSIVGFVCLALIACSDKAVQSDSIYGKWKLMQYYYSIGGPGEWRQATSENTSFLEFKEDGKVTHTGPNIQTYSEGFRLSKDTIVFVRTSDEIKVKYVPNWKFRFLIYGFSFPAGYWNSHAAFATNKQGFQKLI